MMSTLQSIKYRRGDFLVLDQLLLPHEHQYVTIRSVQDGVSAIKTMQVRGAPLIAVVGCLSIAVELHTNDIANISQFLEDSVAALIDARPTAVNMKTEGLRLLEFSKNVLLEDLSSEDHRGSVIEYIENLMEADIATNVSIGDHGRDVILRTSKNPLPMNILTHCNTGSLATCGHGTALGVVRSLHKHGELGHVYFTETRPYNQGSRLTSFELLHDNIPSTMVCDSAVSWLMKKKVISAVVVGADRVARNGDTANKIGTYQLAITAKAHGVPFFVAAPFTTIDPNILSGEMIDIEERPAEEVTHLTGNRISPEGITVWNPAFDVTPADLICAIITEKKFYTPQELESYFSV